MLIDDTESSIISEILTSGLTTEAHKDVIGELSRIFKSDSSHSTTIAMG